ncbi:MAG: protein kinase [Candidatus Latescibacteria bacterium]|jgi:serine/threonine protein kinase|nr:protein kinase [Candidatus Latescibacterota bacterium]
MFCDKCGTENRDGANFCAGCGSQMPKNITPASLPGAKSPQTDGGEESYIKNFSEAVSERYNIIRELGRGGMAIVFLAEDKRLERKVALKLLPQEFSYDENFAQRFLREAKISAKLLHPNIIQIHDVETSGDFYYYSMTYVEGISLDQIIKKSGALKPKVIAKTCVLVSFALQHAHDHGIVHRDIKPENIIINKKRQPIVVDFGIAKAQRSAKLSQTGLFIGTPMYMSPEQIKAENVDSRSDIYSLGCVLYKMATGETPFHGLQQTALLYKQVNEMPPPPQELNQTIPPELSAIIMKTLQKDPGDRYQSASEVGKALHEAFLAAPTGSNDKEAKKQQAPAQKAAPAKNEEQSGIGTGLHIFTTSQVGNFPF